MATKSIYIHVKMYCQGVELKRVASSPAWQQLFNADDLPPVTVEVKKWFHYSYVAKMLYLSKLVKLVPDYSDLPRF